MELRATRQMRRSEQLSKTTAKKAPAQETPAKPRSAQTRPPADRLSLSRQALAFLEKQNRRAWEQAREREQRRRGRMDDSLSALEDAKQELDAMGRQLKMMRKCQQIAASIMKGNRAPPEDLEYLMKNDPEGYKLAMAMRRENPDPKDEKIVLEEEDRKGGAEGPDAGGEAPSVSAAEPPAGGASSG